MPVSGRLSEQLVVGLYCAVRLIVVQHHLRSHASHNVNAKPHVPLLAPPRNHAYAHLGP